MADATLPSLATPDDVVARLGRNLNQLEAARIDSLLADGSAIIRRFCRRDFVRYTDDERVLRSDGGTVILPDRPVVGIKSVSAVMNAPGIPDLPVTWWIFDGIDKLTIPDPSSSGVINLSEMWYDLDWVAQTFRVVYTHGLASAPSEVVGLLCSATISALTAPTMAGGVASETVGAYSYSLRPGGAGIRSLLRDAGMEEVLADYRTKHGTLKIASG